MADDKTSTTGSTRPSPADLWNQREPAKRGPKIAPIWIVLGMSVVLGGILLGQMFAPSGATASESSSTPAPAPSVSASPYGAPPPMEHDARGNPVRHLHGAAAPQTTPVPAPTATNPEQERVATDQQYAGGAWPTVQQLATEPMGVPSVSTGPVPAPSSESTGGVTVYTRESPGSVAPALTAQIAASQNQTATTEGDNTGRSERGGTELLMMPREVVTPAPLTVPAATRVSMTIDIPTDSDLSGPVTAHNVEDVCDPRTGELAWPRGSDFLGHILVLQSGYQRHLGFAWDSVRFADLTRRSLVGSVVTEDEEGHTGITGHRNAHTWSIFRDSIIGSIANSAGQILSNLTAKVGAQAPVVVVPQSQGNSGSSLPVDIPTIEIGRTVPFDMVLLGDYTANQAYNEPGWQGCRS